MLEAESVWIKTGLLARLNFPGLRKQIQFEKPVIYFQKGSKGSWNWLSAKTKSSRSISLSKSASASLSFGEGKLRYKDASSEPAFAMEYDFSSADFGYKPGAALDGEIKIKGNKKIPENYILGFTYQAQDDSLVFQLTSSDNKIEFHGTVQNFSGDFYTQFSTKIHLKEMKLVSPHDIGFAGLVTVQAEGASQGSHPKTFLRYLSLTGALDIRHGTLLRANILAQILHSLKPVASLALPKIEGGLPADYQGLIKGADTAFQVLQTHVEVSDGLLRFEALRVKHPEYYLEGEGSYDMPNGKMDFRARFVTLENLTSWFIKENQAFKSFENESGRLVLPFLYRGLNPDIELEMDWDQISSIVKNKQIKEKAEMQKVKS